MSSLAELPELIGFFSYSRQDDVDSLGALSDLRDRIYRELSMRLGRDQRDFRLWQDKAAIPFGALWKDEITRAIEESAFFIPIVSPRTVRSEHCKFEFEAFLAREKALGRDNLVFPILYVEVPGLDREDYWRANDVLRIVNDRQFADWRAIRHLDVGSVEIKRRIESFCRNIVEALERTSARRRTSAPTEDRGDSGPAKPTPDVVEEITLPRDDVADNRAAKTSQSSPRPSEDRAGNGRGHLVSAAIGLTCLCVGLAAAFIFRPGWPVSPSIPIVTDPKPSIPRPVMPVPVPVPSSPSPSPVPPSPPRQGLAVDGGFPIDVGDTVADVQRAFATSKQPIPMSGSSTEKTMIRLDQLGVWFFFDSRGKIYTVRFDKPWSGRVAGIAIGDPKSKVEAALGTPVAGDAASHGSGPYYYDGRYVYRRAGTFYAVYFFDSASRVETILVP